MTDEKMINLIYDKLFDNDMNEQFCFEHYDEGMLDNATKKVVFVLNGNEYELALKNNGKVWGNYEPNLTDRERGVLTKSESETIRNAFEYGWDNGVETYEQVFGADDTTKEYWGAYDFAVDNNIDSGKCFEIRQACVDKIYDRACGKLCGNVEK